MKKTLYKVWSKFLEVFGNIKVFRFPLFLVYDPDEFKVTGQDVLDIMSILEPGDIILRGYDRYLDGKFIPDKLKFSHGAVYAGKDKVIHAVAAGVSEENIITFTQCDRIAIFRPKCSTAKKNAAVKKAKVFLRDKIPYDYGFQRGVSSLYCFELCAECYPTLDIQTTTAKKLWGLLKKENVYLAESFFKSKDLECICHFNSAFHIHQLAVKNKKFKKAA